MGTTSIHYPVVAIVRDVINAIVVVKGAMVAVIHRRMVVSRGMRMEVEVVHGFSDMVIIIYGKIGK